MAIDTQDMEVGRGDDVEFDERGEALVYEVTGEFPSERESPGEARRLVVAALQEWGCDDALIDDVALVVTELASNVVLHVRTPLSISLQVQGSMLRIAVRDGISPRASECERWIVPRPLHGLDLIDAVSTRWGVEDAPDGKVVWAELAGDAHGVRRFERGA